MPYYRNGVDKFLEKFSYAMIIEKEGNYDRAVSEYISIADSASKWGLDPRFEAGAYEQIANSFLRRHINDSALVYMHKYVEIAEKAGITHMFAAGLRQLSQLYASMGEKELSMDIKSRYLDLKDLIFNETEFNRENNRLQIYEEEKYQDTIYEYGWDRCLL